ncbi:MAG: hypothetical protein ACOC56_05280, partial [Atribacterota bacterium]
LINLPYKEKMKESHKLYKKKTITHAKNDLSIPINNKSLMKWHELDGTTINTIISSTKETHEKYGYYLSSQCLNIIDIDRNIIDV